MVDGRSVLPSTIGHQPPQSEVTAIRIGAGGSHLQPHFSPDFLLPSPNSRFYTITAFATSTPGKKHMGVSLEVRSPGRISKSAGMQLTVIAAVARSP
jgi:hypothetical protein